MSLDLVYRLRTCAAAIDAAESGWAALVADDAAGLLKEAADLIEKQVSIEAQIEPEPVVKQTQSSPPVWIEASPVGPAQWTAVDLPRPRPTYENPRICPACLSEAPKTVRARQRNKILLECPACQSQWEYVA